MKRELKTFLTNKNYTKIQLFDLSLFKQETVVLLKLNLRIYREWIFFRRIANLLLLILDK